MVAWIFPGIIIAGLFWIVITAVWDAKNSVSSEKSILPATPEVNPTTAPEMDRHISEGMKRAIIAGGVLVAALFAASVVNTRWNFEEKCVYTYTTNDYTRTAPDFSRKEKSFIQKVFDEEVINLHCELSPLNSNPPSYGSIFVHHFLILLKYVTLIIFVVILPLLGIMWVKKGFEKSKNKEE